VVLRVDEAEERDCHPKLIFPSKNVQELSYGLRELSESLKRTILDIAEKAI
jgi:hypothetical protein